MGWLRRWLLRLGKLGVAVAVLVVLVVAGFFASLPEIVRQVAVRQVPKAIGRQLSIEDIDLNLFTGHVAIKNLRLAERQGPEAWVQFERLEARLSLWWLVRQNIRVRDFRLVGPVIRIVRREDATLNFHDLLPGVKQADIAREPTKWTVTIDHAAIERGRLAIEDRAVSPVADWSIQALELDTVGLSTRPNSPPGRLKASLRTGAATLEIRWDKFEQAPVKVVGGVKLSGFDLTRVRPYLPPPLAAALASGTLGFDLAVDYSRTVEGLQTALASGDMALESLKVVKTETKDTLLALPRLGVGLKRFDLEGREVTLGKVELSGLDARLHRDEGGQIDLVALLAGPADEAAAREAKPGSAPAQPTVPGGEPAPKPWKVRVEQVRVDGAKISLTDDSVAPAVKFSAVFGTALAVEYTPTAAGVQTVLASGDVTASSVTLDKSETRDRLLAIGRLGVGLTRFDLAGREVTLSRVEVSGLDARLHRDKTGQVDLLVLAAGEEEPGTRAEKVVEAVRRPTAQPVAPVRREAPAPRPWKIGVERTKIAGGKVAFADESVEPAADLTLSNLDLAVDRITWPVRGPASLTLSASLPVSGTVKVQGPVILRPFDAELTIAIRDAVIEPYRTYMPVAARLSGRFNGDSWNHIALKGDKTILASKGSSWAEGFEARLPGAESKLIAIERMDLVDIDFDWPTRARVAKVGFTRPALEIERAKDGTLNILRAFSPPPAADSPATESAKPSVAAPPASPKPPGLLETIKLDFPEIRLEDGSVRFIDRTTEPAFSEDLSKMNLLVTGLSNAPDSKAKLVFTTVVGGDAGLDIRGDMGAIGAPLFVDLGGEIRDLQLPAVNPYSDQAVAWLIRQGNLKFKFNIKIDHDQLTAMNDIVVGKLKVARAKRLDDKVKAKLGLPLGLIVALVKDLDGNIVLHVPVSGSLKDPNFDLSDSIWTAIKNVLVNILASPFRLIGSLFSRGDKIEEPKVDPVTFPPGSAALSPGMEEHLLRVADFMRRTPYVALTMHPVVTAADADTLKAAEVAQKLQQFAKERGITEPPQVVRAYFQAHVPSEKLPATTDEQLKLLRDREPVPEAKLKELEQGRLAVTKERLVKKEGIQDKRLPAGEPRKPAAGAAQGAVEFSIGEGEEE